MEPSRNEVESLLKSLFPNLVDGEFSVESPWDISYNCIAWAAEDRSGRWWWPTGGMYWPSGVPREESIAAFEAAYGQLGYEACASAELEPGYEKVAIYVDENGTPTHAARQLESGIWSSKLGQLNDIEHLLPSLRGVRYGEVGRILRRRKQDNSAQL